MISKLFNKILNTCINRPRLILAIFALLLVFPLIFLSRLQLKTSNLDLIGQDIPEVKRFLDISNDFGNPNFIIAVLEGKDSQEIEKAVETLAPLFREIRGVRSVIEKIPIGPRHYFTSKNRDMYFIFIQPEDARTNVEEIAPVLNEINKTIQTNQKGFQDIEIGLTGIPQYAINDRDIIQKDISWLSGLSLVLILIIFSIGFHNLRRPFLGTITLGISVIFSLGVVEIYPGHLTLLSAPFAAMIFGLGVDFAIHIINLMEDYISEGHSEKEAISRAITQLKRPLTTAALTTAGVFFILTQSGFLGFIELGVIAGIGVLICLALMFTAFPALLSLAEKTKPTPPQKPRKPIGAYLTNPKLKYVGMAILLTSGSFFFFQKPGFDSNYLNLQPKNSNAVRLEKEMIQNSVYSPNFAIFRAPNVKEADELTQKLRRSKTVGAVRTLSDLTKRLPPGSPLPDMPEEFKNLFINEKGEYAVYAYPQENIWKPEVEEEFLTEMEKIDPEVTGMPILGHFMIDRSKRALTVTSQMAIFALLLILFWDFRKPRLVFVTMIPPVLTIFWMRGFMDLFQISFNPLNVMALPIVLGIAVDDGVHIMHRFIIENGDLNKTMSGTGRSVILTSLTTIAAFGSLAFTSHRGLRSFSLTLTIGVASALIISIFLFPWVLNFFKKKLVPAA